MGLAANVLPDRTLPESGNGPGGVRSSPDIRQKQFAQLTLPAGATLSPQDVCDDADDSDFEPLNLRVSVTLPSGVTSGFADAGLIGVVVEATGDGIIFLDKNGDGIQNGKEKGLKNVDVLVTASDGSTFTVATGSRGACSFTTVPGQVMIDVDEDSLPGNRVETTGNSTQTIDLVVGQTTTFDPIGYTRQQGNGGGRGGNGGP